MSKFNFCVANIDWTTRIYKNKQRILDICPGMRYNKQNMLQQLLIFQRGDFHDQQICRQNHRRYQLRTV